MNAKEPGTKVILARSAEGNAELRDRLTGLGVESVAVETIAFYEPADWAEVDGAILRLNDYQWVVFTSPRAVAPLLARMERLGVGVGSLTPRVAAVGPRTAAELKSAGFRVDFVPEEYLTAELGEGIPAGPGSKLLLLRADIGEKSLFDSLTRRGFEVTDVAVYRTAVVPGSADTADLTNGNLVVFASPSEVRALRARLSPAAFRELAARATAACIGPVTADAARSAGFQSVAYPEEHTIDGLVDKVRELTIDA